MSDETIPREKVEALAEQVRQLMVLYEKRQKMMRKLVAAALQELDGKTTPDRRKELLAVLKEVVCVK